MFGQHNGLSSLSALRDDELQLREVFLVLDQDANARAFAQVLLEQVVEASVVGSYCTLQRETVQTQKKWRMKTFI